MTLTAEVWTAVSLVFIAILLVSAPGYYLGALLFLTSRREHRVFARPRDAVTILIPARNEGRGALLAVQSLLAQDYDGLLEIALLVRDSSDTSLPSLHSAFPHAPAGGKSDAAALPPGPPRPLDSTQQQLFQSENRIVSVYFTSCDAKHAKINWMLPHIASPFTAILDADHEAHADWIHTSVAMLKEGSGRIVQSRREPLSAHGLFGLWDSLHQHIGCEVFNEAFSRLGLTVFFTGSTAVFESAVLKEHPLSESLTEDTNLSYERVLAGERILYNPYSGSREDVSPNLYSFLARRRRWAHGHTEAFLLHMHSFWRAPLGLAERLQFLFHGLHYLLALSVFGIHLMIGAHMARILAAPALITAGLIGMILAMALVQSQHIRRGITAAAAFTVLFLWFTPAFLFLLTFARAAFSGDYSPLLLPLPAAVQILGLAALAAPLFLLLAGLLGWRQLGLGITVALILTYPAGLYLYISGVLIGLIDLVSGHRIWLVIGRAAATSSHGTGPRGIRDSWRTRTWFRTLRSLWTGSVLKPSQWILAAAVLLLLFSGIYFGRSTAIPVAARACKVLEHDKDPWIVPAEKLPGYCDNGVQSTPGNRPGSFALKRRDDFSRLESEYWDRLDSTFFCNEAVFAPANVLTTPGGLDLLLRAEPKAGKKYTAASIATKDEPNARHLYGRFEAELKPVAVSGVLTALFLYRFDPWQEIDMEFLGKDTSKVLLNVFYNPGVEGDLYNYGFRGTPILVDLGFDASREFHRYAIEWDPSEIRWFVDDVLIHARPAGKPTPIPHLPMRLHINTWPICSEELAGKIDASKMPAAAGLRSVTISEYKPPIVESLFPREAPQKWRDEAKWMQPGR